MTNADHLGNIFGVRYFPKGIFPRETPKCAISQEATYRRLGLALWGAAGCNGGRSLRLGQTWEVAVWEIPHLGSCHLGKYPWQVAIWDKIIWESTQHHIFILFLAPFIFSFFFHQNFRTFLALLSIYMKTKLKLIFILYFCFLIKFNISRTNNGNETSLQTFHKITDNTFILAQRVIKFYFGTTCYKVLFWHNVI